MFGLMRHTQRLPYCGTCKTLGTLYGQRSRLLLNNDSVFLAELLMQQSGAPDWSPTYRSFNCLTLPRPGEPLPLALQFAATTAVALAHFKIADHRSDSRQLHWRVAAGFFSPSYRKAAARLRGWRFPLDEMRAILATQTAREAHPLSLAYVAEPTAIATALVFSHGARLVGRDDQADSMYQLGRSFGYLIYVLDAYEDRERDRRTGNFNPLLGLQEISARGNVLDAATAVERQLTPDFAARLRTNVEERLGLRPRVLHQHRCRKPIKVRWTDAVVFARSLRDREQPGLLKGAAVLATVSVLAFLFPHPIRSAESSRHCLGLGMNLMALGAIFATSPSGPSMPPVTPFSSSAPKKINSPGGGGDGGCDCGDGCDCNCCDGCDCGSCDCG